MMPSRFIWQYRLSSYQGLAAKLDIFLMSRKLYGSVLCLFTKYIIFLVKNQSNFVSLSWKLDNQFSIMLKADYHSTIFHTEDNHSMKVYVLLGDQYQPSFKSLQHKKHLRNYEPSM